MLDFRFRRLFGAFKATALAELNATGLQHENVKTCVRRRNFKVNIALAIRQIVVKRYRLAPSEAVAQAVLDDIFRQSFDVGVAWNFDAGTKQRAKKFSFYTPSSVDERKPRLRHHSGLAVSSFGEKCWIALREMLLSLCARIDAKRLAEVSSRRSCSVSRIDEVTKCSRKRSVITVVQSVHFG